VLPLNVIVPSELPLSLKVTLPVGVAVPADGTMVAVKVTFVPTRTEPLADEIRFTVSAAGCTVIASAPLVELAP